MSLYDEVVQTRLVAHRPEAWRFARLTSVFEVAEKFVEDTALSQQWSGALWELADFKGDARATWRSAEDREAFSALIDQAWQAKDEGDPVYHVLYSDLYDEDGAPRDGPNELP